MIITKTPLRVSFLGGGTDYPEYFVKHGGAVIGTAVDKSAFFCMSPFYSKLFDYSIRIAYRQVECVNSIDELEHAPFRECLRWAGVSRDIEINHSAELPAFTGLGSSSSFVVGLLNTLHTFNRRMTPPLDLAYEAVALERGPLGESVGCQDQTLAAVGGFNLIEFHGLDDFVVHRIPLSPARLRELEDHLLVFFTGIKRRAEEMAGRQAARRPEPGTAGGAAAPGGRGLSHPHRRGQPGRVRRTVAPGLGAEAAGWTRPSPTTPSTRSTGRASTPGRWAASCWRRRRRFPAVFRAAGSPQPPCGPGWPTFSTSTCGSTPPERRSSTATACATTPRRPPITARRRDARAAIPTERIPPMLPLRPAVFLDRDGVLIEDVHYLKKPEQVQLTPGAGGAVARLNAAGLPVVVVTNQSGVARGYFPAGRVAEVHQRLDQLLAEEGARVDRYYFCPHHPEGTVPAFRVECDCRKPRPGLVLRAACDLGIDLGASYLVGDKLSDLEAGAAAGCRTLLVRTGHGRSVRGPLPAERLRLLAVTVDLPEAAAMVLARRRRRAG